MMTLNDFFDEIENMKEDIFIYRDEKISVIFDKNNGLKILNLNYSNKADDKSVVTEKKQQRRRNIYILKEHKNNKKKRK